MTVGAKRLEVTAFVVGVIAVKVMYVELAYVFRHEAAAFAVISNVFPIGTLDSIPTLVDVSVMSTSAAEVSVALVDDVDRTAVATNGVSVNGVEFAQSVNPLAHTRKGTPALPPVHLGQEQKEELHV